MGGKKNNSLLFKGYRPIEYGMTEVHSLKYYVDWMSRLLNHLPRRLISKYDWFRQYERNANLSLIWRHKALWLNLLRFPALSMVNIKQVENNSKSYKQQEYWMKLFGNSFLVTRKRKDFFFKKRLKFIKTIRKNVYINCTFEIM